MNHKSHIFISSKDSDFSSKIKEVSADNFRFKKLNKLDTIKREEMQSQDVLLIDISTLPNFDYRVLDGIDSFKILVYDRYSPENISELLPFFDFYISKSIPASELKNKMNKIRELLRYSLNRITHLPGSIDFENYYSKDTSPETALAFLDIDNFKYFCAAKGYAKSEMLLRLVSNIIKKNIFTSTIKSKAMAFNIFLDRFAIVSDRDEITRICSFIYEDFARYKNTLFDNNELTRQFYVMQDRTGNIFDIPITTITTAVITRHFESTIELYKNTEDIFRYIKGKGGNLIFSDRRQITNQNPEKGIVLLAVYDQMKCNYLKISLERMGWKVFITNDGITTLKLYNRTRPSIIILDEELPIISYKDIINVLRYELSDNKTIIILLGEIDELINSQYEFSTMNGDLNADRINQKLIGLLSHKMEDNT